MPPVAWSSQIFRIDDAANASSTWAIAATKSSPTKPCDATGCLGTMHLYLPMREPEPPTHLEFQWSGWICGLNPAHREPLSLRQCYEAERKYRQVNSDVELSGPVLNPVAIAAVYLAVSLVAMARIGLVFYQLFW